MSITSLNSRTVYPISTVQITCTLYASEATCIFTNVYNMGIIQFGFTSTCTRKLNASCKLNASLSTLSPSKCSTYKYLAV